VRFHRLQRLSEDLSIGSLLFFWNSDAKRSHKTSINSRTRVGRTGPPRFAWVSVAPLLIVGLVSVSAATQEAPPPCNLDSSQPRVVRTHHVMGTRMVTTIEAASRQAALAASESVLEAVTHAERRLSTWTASSELSRINASPVGEPVLLSPMLGRDLEAALQCAHETGGAFTPGIGGLVGAWKLREGGRRPTVEEIESAVAGASLENVRLENDHITRLDQRFSFEEGAFGKGAGLDDALERLRSSAASAAVIDLGGQLAVWGRTTAWVDIAHPRDRGRPILRLEVSRGSVATSGSSERGMVIGGQRLGHVLDPRTGLPTGDFGSVTVWADDATRADCLSTALYVLGPDTAHTWASQQLDLGLVTVTYQGDRLLATATTNLRGRLVTLSDEVVLNWHGLNSDHGTSALWHVDQSHIPFENR